MKSRKVCKWAALAAGLLMVILIGVKYDLCAAVWAYCAMCWFAVYKSIEHQEEMEEMVEPIDKLMHDLLMIACADKENEDDHVHTEGEA